MHDIPTTPKGYARGIRGALLSFSQDPFISPQQDSYTYIDDALIITENGRIADVGEYKSVAPRWPGIETDSYPDALIIPGMVDCHAHYVQSPMVGSYGDTLLDWLNRYTFPTEARFADKNFADATARVFMRQIFSHGTTTANVFATTFATSVDAFFEEAHRQGALMICGKVLQDRNLPEALRDRSAEESIDISEELLLKWHGQGRLFYAVTPRFAPTSTPRQLDLAGQLYRKYQDRGVFMNTHLNEADAEIAWVKELFPGAKNYTDVYEHAGLLGPRSVLAHCCIMTEPEWDTLARLDCSAAHCPASNLFLGDGEFRYWEAKDKSRPVRLGIGTDIGGGTSFSILRNLGEAYKVGMLRAHGLTALRAFYLATRGGAEALGLEERIGSVAPGFDADLAVLDMHATDYMKWRMEFTDTLEERLFVLQTLGCDRSVRATYVAGRKVYDSASAV